MKRIIGTLLLCSAIFFGITACSSADDEDNSTKSGPGAKKSLELLKSELVGTWIQDLDEEDNEFYITEYQIAGINDSSQKSFYRTIVYTGDENKPFADVKIPVNFTMDDIGDSLMMKLDTSAEVDDEKTQEVVDELKEISKENDYIIGLYFLGDLSDNTLPLYYFSVDDESEEDIGGCIFLQKTDAPVNVSELNVEEYDEKLQAIKSEIEKESEVFSEKEDWSFNPDDASYTRTEEIVTLGTEAARAADNNEPVYTYNWMKKIPDDRLLSQMVLPASHDSATFNCADIIATFGQTKKKDFRGQFDSGCRVFDLRVRAEYDNLLSLKDPIHLYHSCIPCYVGFAEALKSIAYMVKINPTEGAVIIVATENNDIYKAIGGWSFIAKLGNIVGLNFATGSLNEEATWKGVSDDITEVFSDSDYSSVKLAKFKKGMTMGDLRGKILIVEQQVPENLVYSNDKIGKAARCTSWTDGTLEIVGGGENERTKISGQNNWGSDSSDDNKNYINNKKKEFKDMISKAATYGVEDDVWIYNAVNGYVKAAWGLPDYSTMAESTYGSFIDNLNSTKTRGIILQDFVGLPKYNRLAIGQVVAIVVSACGYPDVGIPCSKYTLRQAHFWLLIKTAKALTSDEKVRGDELMLAALTNNFKQ